MWKETPQNPDGRLAQPKKWDDLFELYNQYYADYYNRWDILRELVIHIVPKKYLDLASASTLSGETFVNLTWKEVYPIPESSPKWSAKDEHEYNKYNTRLSIWLGGSNGHYNVQVGFSVSKENTVLNETTDIIPVERYKKIIVPIWFKDNLNHIFHNMKK